MTAKKTTIQLDEQTKALLTIEGKMDETYNQLIGRLLAELKGLRNGRKPKA